MKEVARQAGVSTATVSRVLSNAGYVSPTTRAHVEAVADRLGYRLDAVAQGLRKRRSTTLGILVPDLTNPVTLAFIRGVQHVAQLSGYAVIIADAQRSAAVERRQLELFANQRVAAIIVTGIMQDPSALSIAKPGGSLIVRSPDSAAGSLEVEGRAIAEAMADLAGRGHRGVLFASRAPASDVDPPRTLTEVRRRAVRASSEREGVRVEECVLPSDLPAVDAARRLSGSLRKRGGPRALICASHRLAPQILGVLAGMGWDMPRHISFITFGDSEWAAAYRPALSVIRLDRYQQARRITHDLLVELGNTLDPEDAPADPSYCNRESVGDCPETSDYPR
jgi:DNA-binding LacI/PurR family transcriptional regulator